MKEYTYYCIMRPPAPGAIPRGAVEVFAYATREYVAEIDRMAWGWVKYEVELTPREIAEYELTARPREDECDG